MIPKPEQNALQVNLERLQANPETFNDVFSPEFQSKMDPYFSLKTTEKDHWTRKSSIKLFGQWT